MFPSSGLNGIDTTSNPTAQMTFTNQPTIHNLGCQLLTFIPQCLIDAPNPPLVNIYYKNIGQLTTATFSPTTIPTMVPSSSKPSQPTFTPTGYPTSIPTTTEAHYTQVVLSVQQVI